MVEDCLLLCLVNMSAVVLGSDHWLRVLYNALPVGETHALFPCMLTVL